MPQLSHLDDGHTATHCTGGRLSGHIPLSSASFSNSSFSATVKGLSCSSIATENRFELKVNNSH